MTEQEFALRLAKLREEKGVSARDMSLSMGQNPGYINIIENGKTKPSLAGILYICEYLGITPKDFFDTEVKNPSKATELYAIAKGLSFILPETGKPCLLFCHFQFAQLIVPYLRFFAIKFMLAKFLGI